MITHELAQIWITSDGKRFLTKDKAVKHEESIQPKDITQQWLDKIKGVKMNIDIKSLIIGMLIIIALLVLTGFGGSLGSSPYNPLYVKVV